MKEDIDKFRSTLTKQFSAVTALDDEQSNEILFGTETFEPFDTLTEQGNLDLVKTQLQFFELGIVRDDYSSDPETAKILTNMLLETQQMIFGFALSSYRNKKISKEDLQLRAKTFIGLTNNNQLKMSIAKNVQNLTGEPLFVEVC